MGDRAVQIWVLVNTFVDDMTGDVRRAVTKKLMDGLTGCCGVVITTRYYQIPRCRSQSAA